mmetsp:Transcript_12827/g.40709  ORF Transcript_12827/g.40709 Transcript_12827/m.40709 type:complete len:447 (+) Transcript_12827:326-1666(+)
MRSEACRSDGLGHRGLALPLARASGLQLVAKRLLLMRDGLLLERNAELLAGRGLAGRGPPVLHRRAHGLCIRGPIVGLSPLVRARELILRCRSGGEPLHLAGGRPLRVRLQSRHATVRLKTLQHLLGDNRLNLQLGGKVVRCDVRTDVVFQTLARLLREPLKVLAVPSTTAPQADAASQLVLVVGGAVGGLDEIEAVAAAVAGGARLVVRGGLESRHLRQCDTKRQRVVACRHLANHEEGCRALKKERPGPSDGRGCRREAGWLVVAGRHIVAVEQPHATPPLLRHVIEALEEQAEPPQHDLDHVSDVVLGDLVLWAAARNLDALRCGRAAPARATGEARRDGVVALVGVAEVPDLDRVLTGLVVRQHEHDLLKVAVAQGIQNAVIAVPGDHAGDLLVVDIVAFGGQGVDVVPAHLLDLEAVFREELPLVGKLAKHHLHHVALQLD